MAIEKDDIIDYASPVTYMFVLDKLPKFSHYVTSITYPGLNISELMYATRLQPISIEGNDITFEDLTCTFLIDKHFENYKSIYDWIAAMGFPADNSQFEDFVIKSQAENAAPAGKSLYSTASIIHTTSKNNPHMETKFYDLFPVSLSGFEYNQNVTDIDYIKATVTFKYQHYEIIKLT
jgi:hypothetical protein